jgi:hypothetical protein
MQIPCVYLPGPAPAVSVANSIKNTEKYIKNAEKCIKNTDKCIENARKCIENT